MHLSGLDFLFWAASFLGHLVLLFVLWARHRAKTFPFFTTLISANIVKTIALYLVFHHGTKASYFYTYWCLAVVDVVLQLCVIYEMSSRVFRPLGLWARDLRYGFVWVVGGSIAVAAGLTSLASPPARFGMQTVIIKGNFFSSALISELFVGMIVLSATGGLPWRAHVVAISQGLGVYSMVDILIAAGHSYFGVARGTRGYAELSHVRIAVYLGCLVYWIITLWRQTPAPRKLPEQMRAQLFALQGKMEYGLQSLRARKKC